MFIADGTSDLPLGQHLERLCSRHGLDVAVTSPNPARLPLANVGSTVKERLEFLRDTGNYDVYFVHRDAEARDPEPRCREVLGGAADAGLAPEVVVPVVPIRMTEAWLLLDEQAIRTVAGKPTGRRDLELPGPREVERVADPKRALRDALLTASESTGRRRKQFDRDFARHRQLLIQRLNTDGSVAQLRSWQALVRSIEAMADRL